MQFFFLKLATSPLSPRAYILHFSDITHCNYSRLLFRHDIWILSCVCLVMILPRASVYIVPKITLISRTTLEKMHFVKGRQMDVHLTTELNWTSESLCTVLIIKCNVSIK